MKILHIVENLDKGAVENWLVNTFIAINKEKPNWQWTFYCILPREGRLDALVKKHNGTILFTPYYFDHKLKMIKALRKHIKENEYNIIHTHHDYLSGLYMLAIAGLGIRKKVVLHLHNMERGMPYPNYAWFRKNIYLPLCRQSALYFSNYVIGNSKDTVLDFVNKDRKNAFPLYYGIDFNSKITPVEKGWLKKELKIHTDTKTLLFVGRLYKYKNPALCIDILNELNIENKNISLVFVGQGEDDTMLKEKAASYNLESKIHFLGWRNDVTAIMQECDLLLFPRLEQPMEGFGLNVVEAQACGLPILTTNGVPKDAACIPNMVYFFSINNAIKAWANEVEKILSIPKPYSTVNEYINAMKHSKVGIQQCVDDMISLYTKISAN